VSHRGADELSAAIARGDMGSGAGLGDIVSALEYGLPPVGDDAARERVRRRLSTASPRHRSARELLVDRALEELERLQNQLVQDDYVPWPTMAAAAAGIGLAAVAYWWWRPRLGNQPLR